MRPSEAQAVLKRLAAAYRAELSAATVLVYTEAIGAFALDAVAFAVDELIRHHDRMPTPSVLVEACRAQERRLAADSPTRALPPGSEPPPANTLEAKAIGNAGLAAARKAFAEAKPWSSRQVAS